MTVWMSRNYTCFYEGLKCDAQEVQNLQLHFTVSVEEVRRLINVPCVTHIWTIHTRTIISTKATRTVMEALLQQSLTSDKCYRAGERITEPDCQGEEGRAGNNRQSKKNNKMKILISNRMRI